MPELTTIFTGSYKIISPLHHYDKANATEDVVVIVAKPYDTLYYISIDNKKNSVILRKNMACVDRVKNVVMASDTSIRRRALTIDNVFGVYSYQGIDKVATIFVLLKNIKIETNYLVQINVLNDDVNSLEVIGIPELYNKKHIYFDTNVTSNVIVTDTKTTTDVDAFIAYINMDVNQSLRSADVEGLQILMNDEEKSYIAEKQNVTIPTTRFPVLDIWSPLYRKFFRLPEDTNKIKFNFSTGLGFIGFD